MIKALALSVALLASGLAACAQTTPPAPAQPKLPLDIVDRTKEPVGQAFTAEVGAYFGEIPGIDIKAGEADKDDTTRPELIIMSRKVGDSQVYVVVAVLIHVQGKNLPVYLGTYGAVTTADGAKALADKVSELVGATVSEAEPFIVADYPNAFDEPQPQSETAPSQPDSTTKI